MPLALIEIKSPRFGSREFVSVEAGVSPSCLPFGCDILLGNDIFLYNRCIHDDVCANVPSSNAADENGETDRADFPFTQMTKGVDDDDDMWVN